LGLELLLTDEALVPAPTQTVAAVQMQTHVVLALGDVAAESTAETRRGFVCVSQHHVWRKDKFEMFDILFGPQ